MLLKLGRFKSLYRGGFIMEMIAVPLVFAAIQYSIIYMLLGGGFFGAIVIFFVAKMLGQ